MESIFFCRSNCKMAGYCQLFVCVSIILVPLRSLCLCLVLSCLANKFHQCVSNANECTDFIQALSVDTQHFSCVIFERGKKTPKLHSRHRKSIDKICTKQRPSNETKKTLRLHQGLRDDLGRRFCYVSQYENTLNAVLRLFTTSTTCELYQ